MELIPALGAIYQDDHPFLVIQKSAQVFASEFLINTALWAADTKQGGRGNALYVMPTQTQMDDFSQARFDKAIGESPYLQHRLKPLPPGRTAPSRLRLKRVGPGYVYFQGADSSRQLTSVDADVVLLDEYDLMAEGVLARAQKRLASSRLGWMRLASTPRYPEAGINELFLQSDRRFYFIKCPACGHEQRLIWEENVDLKKAAVVCSKARCRGPLDLRSPGRWIAEAPGNDRVRGYHLSRLYSPLANLRQMVYESEATSPSEIQEFQNSVLGETFVPPGGSLSLDLLDRCRRDYELPEGSKEMTYMGVDVGTKLHVVIRRRLGETGDASRALFVGELTDFTELATLGQRFNVQRCVIDAQPEVRAAAEFARNNRDMRVDLANYSRRELGTDSDMNGGVRFLSLNRTETMDALFEAFRNGRAELPRNARQLGGRVRDGFGDYYRQVMAPKRQLEQDAQGNWTSRYDEHGKPDHYAHAENYCLQAMLAPRGFRMSAG